MTWLLKTVPTQFQRGCPSADRYEVACKKTPCLACLRHSGVMRPRRPQARSSSHSLLATWRLLSITIRPIYTEDSASQEYKATRGFLGHVSPSASAQHDAGDPACQWPAPTANRSSSKILQP
ncbi:hypothetical protein BD309DRAFT_1041273 [Dichomitus squalens]|uniref:Uncharacterized protein n=2 Tax=Dichomitus squalens TaxID=114155 RepID=A0A4Q9NJQ2_9APHY|nr:uncharacterized protein DICSQDRAFT_149022 [Dichomitus squalens LYAD-421 SS1]EJF58515.1 hypothetical protein DICSQDRAFT_149022 [Dichomitus squalens LYAD-421 SS1]TBU41540.1 hypothetical protein BD309DRAFT_1041273 [Dichomitus squalens]TBU52806.1 hypothetical protein BD310DRAFT_995860 [Dichomitus squalens]